MSRHGKSKLQPQHAAPAAHCTNHYTRSVQQLEVVLEERLAQLSVLAQENSTLKRREAALQSAVSSLAGSVSAATKAVLVSSEAEAADALRTTLESSSPDVRCSISDHKSFLLRMQQREAAVQRIMGQLGCVDSDALYSSWLLRRAFANPERANAHLSRSKKERVADVLATVQKLGLLLGKYDLLHHPITANGTPREQADNLIDDLNERTLAFCLLAPPYRQLEMACLNLETRLPEPYPRGWWAVVIDAMQLTEDQKAALRICWDKVKPIKLALTAKYEALSAQLARLQRKQLDQQRQFEIQAEQAIDAAIGRKVARRHKHKQDQQQAALAQQQVQQPQQQQATWDQLLQQQQQQPVPVQQEPQEQLLDRSSILDAVAHEQELIQFCWVLLGSEVEGMKGMSDQLLPKDFTALAATATSAPTPVPVLGKGQNGNAAGTSGQACSMPMVIGAAGMPAQAVEATLQQHHQHQQHQGYAARMAPLQLQPQQQQQFMQFSPAVAAAAAASDQNLWLNGLSADLGGLSPSQSPQGQPAVWQSDSGSQGTTPGGVREVEGSDAMLVDDTAQHASTSSTDAGRPSKSLDGSSLQSRPRDTPTMSSPAALGTAVAAAAVPAAAAIIAGHDQHQRCSGSSDLWQELAGVLPTAQQAPAQGGSGQSGGQQAVVLQTTDREQRKLERQLDKITAQLKMQQYCMHTYVLNICSKKQMALKYVNCYPWVPESFSMCEALDEMGW